MHARAERRETPRSQHMPRGVSKGESAASLWKVLRQNEANHAWRVLSIAKPAGSPRKTGRVMPAMMSTEPLVFQRLRQMRPHR